MRFDVRVSPPPTASPPRPALEPLRVSLDGAPGTTLHVLRMSRAHYETRVISLDPPRQLLDWCEANGEAYALIGGFYVRPDGIPLGDVRVDGRPVQSRPFDDPWHYVRACVHSHRGKTSVASRIELPPNPPGDLLQAGPRLVRAGLRQIHAGIDPEGFSSGSGQFDSDITEGRYPRAALGLTETEIIAVVSEGRSEDEAGLTLAELAEAMIDLGAEDAINLDGGGSASLIAHGDLVNVPREDQGIELPGGREIATALCFALR